MGKPHEGKMHYEEALKHCIFKYTSGSHQYGTSRPESDIDKRGVFIAPLSCAFDLFQTNFVGSGTIRQHLHAAIDAINNAEFPTAINHINNSLKTDQGDLSLSVETVRLPGNDEELQELRKFLKLASECNPNIIEFLWVEDLIDICTPEWELIKEHRDYFLSKRARWTFAGYAIQQLKRIKMHRNYLLHPPTHKPTRKEFGLPEHSKIPKEHQRAVLSIPDDLVADHAKEQILKEKQYESAMQIWSAYQKWDRERNPARKELEKKYLYDTKHACHLVRLCRMSEEILKDGVVLVRRPDADELREILNGQWEYERIEELADGLDARLDELYKNSNLRDSPNYKGISKLYQEICEKKYNIKL